MKVKQTTHLFNRMRNKSVGDYLYSLDNDWFKFIIADMPTSYQMLVFLHEFVEASLCWSAGINEKDINAFDKKFEQERLGGWVTGEPGDDERACYFKQHQIATRFEKKFCKELGINWKKYSKHIEEIGG